MSEIVLGIRRSPFYIEGMSEPPTVHSELSAEELLYLSLPDKQAELVRGRLIVRERPGYQHGLVAFAIAHALASSSGRTTSASWWLPKPVQALLQPGRRSELFRSSAYTAKLWLPTVT